MINETTPRFFITGMTKENEQSVIDKLERSGFSNWWSLPDPPANYIYVSESMDMQFMKMWEDEDTVYSEPVITAEEYLCKEVSK
ncbi:hypothetical protein Ln9_0047 [Leuconostoc phage Ln-9]|uniref:Uncharacterized protein n=1 Tax=Leuconostoc phage Ln-9 TaxID=1536605 RepID=A0A0D3MKV0_9CAUD|nr:hypothetical protein ACQ47_gp47 [Leuconostoc phage Ln-9]AIM50896.1 hypothetical protein Ln9_0047 [Leuconostoc phage Ln-9]